MKKLMIKLSVLCILLSLSIFTNIIPWNNYLVISKAETVQKATLKDTEGTMGVGCEPIVIQIDNAKYDAEYTFTAADKKLIQVSVQEDQALVYSNAVGTTTVTVKEKYKGKTTTVGVFTVHVVHAQIHEPKLEIGLSRYNTITLLYRNTNAVYTYKSADPKIANVDKDGYISGLKYGKTTIAITETYQGKSVKIGTCNITVAKAKMIVKELKVPVYEAAYDTIPITCRNQKATYQYSSSDSKVVKVDKYGYFSGLKEGKSTITVTETLNKVTTKLGTVTINVVLASIDSNCELVVLGLNSITSSYDIIDEYYNTIPILYRNKYANYTFESADSSIVSIEADLNSWDQRPVIKGAGVGVTTLKVYEEYKGKTRTVGTVKVEVREYPVTAFKFRKSDENETTDTVTRSFRVGGPYDLTFFCDVRPYHSTTPIIFTSSDDTIASVNSEGQLTALKVGEVEITATCGPFTDKMIVYVEE